MTAEWHPRANPWLIAAAVMLATFMEVLDTTIVSVAQPNMAGSLSATTDEASWVLTSYLVANAIVLPASGWFALRFGRRRLLIACTILFVLASFLCGIAPTMGVLIFARVLQGAGGGAMQPLAQAILLESFPAAKRGIAMAVFAFGVVFAPVIGPVAGGWLTDRYSWRWVFNINIPLGLLAVVLMLRYLEDPPYIRDAHAGVMDKVGFAFLALWLATLQIVLDRGQQDDWFASSSITAAAIVSAVSLLAFVLWELRTENPIVDLGVFRDRNFTTCTVLVVIVSAGMYGALTVLPVFMQTLLGYTSQLAGLATMPRGIGALVSTVAVGVLMSRFDGRLFSMAGFVLFGASSIALSNLTLDMSMSSIVSPILVQGMSMTMIFIPLMTLAVGTLPNERMGNATGVFNLVRNLGGSIGISISTTFVVRFAQMHQTSMAAHMTPYDPVYQSRLAGIAQYLTPFTGAPQARQQALGLMQATLLQQSALKAYGTVFLITGLLLLATVPAVLLIRKVAVKGDVMVH
jgi:MFS transporter, DHA2 family, multidrug resistance protein